MCHHRRRRRRRRRRFPPFCITFEWRTIEIVYIQLCSLTSNRTNNRMEIIACDFRPSLSLPTFHHYFYTKSCGEWDGDCAANCQEEMYRKQPIHTFPAPFLVQQYFMNSPNHRLIYAFNSRFFPSLLLLSPFFIAVNKIPLIWRSQRHNEINDRMDSAWRYIPIGRQLGECMGWHLQQPILARDAAEQWLRDTASHVSSKCCPSIFTHKAHREWDENVIWIEIMQTVFASAHLHSALFFMLKLGYGAIARARLRCDCGLQPTRTLKFSSTSNTNAIE